MRNNWEKKIIQITQSAKFSDTDNKNRLLAIRMAQELDQKEIFDNKLNFSRINKEIKFWLYMISFMIKLYFFYKI